jgi:hypothetical protein
MCKHRIQDRTTLKLLCRLLHVVLFLEIKIRIPTLIRYAHMSWIVGVKIVVFFLFGSEFMTMLVALILDLLFIGVVDLEELRSMSMACYIVASICN